jgi:hypothetical protein
VPVRPAAVGPLPALPAAVGPLSRRVPRANLANALRETPAPAPVDAAPALRDPVAEQRELDLFVSGFARGAAVPGNPSSERIDHSERIDVEQP